MDSKQLEQLLEKYWNCETSLEEEKQLREYFQGEVPESLKETADLFRYFGTQQSKSVGGADFDAVVIKKIKRQKPEGKSVTMLFNYARIAAGLIVVVTATYFVRLFTIL